MLSADLLTRHATGRTELLREAILDTAPAICSERARLMTESYRESEGEPTILRKARAFARVLEGMSIYIRPGELVVGNLATNFEGQHGEEVRQLLLNRAPKFGNDDDYVDLLAKKVADCYAEALHRLTNARGLYGPSTQSLTSNVPEGLTTGATPDGRKAGEPLSDNNSPTAGTDVNGPTATAKSVSKLDHSQQTNGTILNMLMHPTALEGADRLRKFSALIRTFFQLKGSQVQFNIVSADMLKDAQLHPENYKNLVVKVAGYSALFSSLDKKLQDQIIQRTSHQVH